MKYDFCTVTDKNYVYKWLALCHSIDRHMPDSKIWVLCLDNESKTVINKLGRKNIETVSIAGMKYPELEKLRETRTKQEFAWTCKPAIMNYLLTEKNVKEMVFVDADLFFYSSVDPIFEKYKDASILITSHKFSKKKAYIADIVGYYNSGFIIFRNDEISRACVLKYKNQCIDWCYNYHDNGRHGDQSYLKTWPKEFKKVEEISEKGINLGTWNLERYRVQKKDAMFYIDDEPLICYHFHGLIAYLGKNATIKLYPITVHHKKIYDFYLKELQKAYDEILAVDPEWKLGFAKKLSFLRIIKQYITQKIRTLCLHTH
jgi:hypothetical protein